MYCNFDDEVFLAPETIISGVLEAEAFDDPQQLTDLEPARQSWHAAAAGSDTDDDDVDADEPAVIRPAADPIDAWSRHARGSSGFGG